MPHTQALVQGGMILALVAVVIVAGFFPRTVRSAPRQPVLRAEVMSLPSLGDAPETATALTATEVSFVVTRVVDATTSVGGSEPRADAARAIDAETSQQADDPADQEDKDLEREEEQLPLFYRYVVRQNDTVTGIASRFGIDAQYIIWNNIGTLTDADLLTPGQQLQIPSVEGIIHGVRLHETLIEIGDLYDAAVSDIVAFPANNISDPDQLQEGSTILVPGGRIVAPLVVRPPPTPVPTPPPATAQATATPTPTTSTYGFIWPAPAVERRITSYFGPSHPLGIDLGMETGTPVVASAGGQVIFVGGHPCCSYGYHVIIKHDETFTTRYGHFSRFAVSLGEWVEQGDLIGYSGSTGASTGPHLHFEIRRQGVVQNPLLYLP